MECDKFLFKVALKDKPNTRRGILSLSSSVYDPLGFVAPIILPAKKLLQELCKQKLGWDDPISDDDGERWEKWKAQLVGLSRITVDRCVKPTCFGDLKMAELHNFADASQIAYGAVSYLRLEDVEERIHCAFLMGEVSPCSLETYDCAKVGTVGCSLSHSVRSDRKRRAGYSD